MSQTETASIFAIRAYALSDYENQIGRSRELQILKVYDHVLHRAGSWNELAEAWGYEYRMDPAGETDPDPAAYDSVNDWLKAERLYRRMTAAEFDAQVGVAKLAYYLRADGHRPLLTYLRRIRDNLGIPRDSMRAAVLRYYQRRDIVGHTTDDDLIWKHIEAPVGSQEEAAARDQLFEKYAWIAEVAARRWRNAGEHEDLVQRGNEMILSAIRNATPGTNLRALSLADALFSMRRAYAESRDPDHDKKTAEMLRAVSAYINRHVDETGREPDNYEIEQATNLTAGQVTEARTLLARRVRSLDEPIGDESGTSRHDVRAHSVFTNEDRPSSASYDVEFEDTLDSALSDLTQPNLTKQIVLHLMEDESLDDVATSLGITTDYAGQLLDEARDRLRTAFGRPDEKNVVKGRSPQPPANPHAADVPHSSEGAVHPVCAVGAFADARDMGFDVQQPVDVTGPVPPTAVAWLAGAHHQRFDGGFTEIAQLLTDLGAGAGMLVNARPVGEPIGHLTLWHNDGEHIWIHDRHARQPETVYDPDNPPFTPETTHALQLTRLTGTSTLESRQHQLQVANPHTDPDPARGRALRPADAGALPPDNGGAPAESEAAMAATVLQRRNGKPVEVVLVLNVAGGSAHSAAAARDEAMTHLERAIRRRRFDPEKAVAGAIDAAQRSAVVAESGLECSLALALVEEDRITTSAIGDSQVLFVPTEPDSPSRPLTPVRSAVAEPAARGAGRRHGDGAVTVRSHRIPEHGTVVAGTEGLAGTLPDAIGAIVRQRAGDRAGAARASVDHARANAEFGNITIALARYPARRLESASQNVAPETRSTNGGDSAFGPKHGLRDQNGRPVEELDEPERAERLAGQSRSAAGVSKRGASHDRNEDAMVVTEFTRRGKPVVVAAVFDGVSGAPDGHRAAQEAATELGAYLEEHCHGRGSGAGSPGRRCCRKRCTMSSRRCRLWADGRSTPTTRTSPSARSRS